MTDPADPPPWCPPDLLRLAHRRASARWANHGADLNARILRLLPDHYTESQSHPSGLLLQIAIGDRRQAVALHLREGDELTIEALSIAGEAPSGPRMIAALAANAEPSAASLVIMTAPSDSGGDAEVLVARSANAHATLDDAELVRVVWSVAERADGWEERYAEEDVL